MTQKKSKHLGFMLGLKDQTESRKSQNKYKSLKQTHYLDQVRYEELKNNLLTSAKKTTLDENHRMFRVKSQTKMKEGALKFKQQIGRIDLLRRGKSSTQEPLNIIFQVLDWLGKNQNFYTDTFAYIGERLKQQTIFNKEQFDTAVIQQIINKTNNDKLIKAMYSNEKSIVSYKQICKSLAQQMLFYVKGMQNERKQYQEYIEQLNRLIGSKKQTISKMKQTVKYYTHHPSQDLYPYIEQLQSKVKIQAKQLEDQHQQFVDSTSNMDVLMSTNALLSQKIDQLNSKLYQIEIQKLSGTESIEKNSQLANFQMNVVSLKSMLDKSVIRMLGMREQFQRLKNHNEKLVSQRSQLAKRAAVGFSQLTPRPNIKKIFQQNQIGYQKVFGQSDVKVSTQILVKSLISKYKKFYTSFKQSESGKKIILDPIGKPLNKFKNPTDDMLRQLKKNKQMIKQTQHFADLVKTKYSRQLQQKKKIMQEFKK